MEIKITGKKSQLFLDTLMGRKQDFTLYGANNTNIKVIEQTENQIIVDIQGGLDESEILDIHNANFLFKTEHVMDNINQEIEVIFDAVVRFFRMAYQDIKKVNREAGRAFKEVLNSAQKRKSEWIKAIQLYSRIDEFKVYEGSVDKQIYNWLKEVIEVVRLPKLKFIEILNKTYGAVPTIDVLENDDHVFHLLIFEPAKLSWLNLAEALECEIKINE